MNDELDFLCTTSKSLIYNKRPFTTKKRKWSFHCLNCEKKFSSDNEFMTHYYIWDDSEFGDPISTYNHLLLCSASCVHQMLEKKNINLKKFDETMRQHDQYWEQSEIEREKKELREKQDAFMNKYNKSPKIRKRNYF